GFERLTGGGNRSPMAQVMTMSSMAPGPRRSNGPAPAGSEYYGERATRRQAAARYAPSAWDEDGDEGEEEAEAAHSPASGRRPGRRGSTTKPWRIYPSGVSRSRLEQAVSLLGVPVSFARDASDADIVLTLKNYYKQKPPALRAAEHEGLPIYVLKS